MHTAGPTPAAALLAALLAPSAADAAREIEHALRADAFSARSVRSCLAVSLTLCLRAFTSRDSAGADDLARRTCAIAALAPHSEYEEEDDADALVLDALAGMLRVHGAQAGARTQAALRALLQDTLRAHPDDARLWALAAFVARNGGSARLEDAVACAAAPAPECAACLAAAVACAAECSTQEPVRPAACACAAHVPDDRTPPALVGRVVRCIPLFF